MSFQNYNLENSVCRVDYDSDEDFLGPERGVSVLIPTVSQGISSLRKPQGFRGPVESSSFTTPTSQSELSVHLLVKNLSEAVSVVAKILTLMQTDFRWVEETNEIWGVSFSKAEVAHWKLQFTAEQGVSMFCNRINGSAFAMVNFFETMKRQLAQQGVTEDEEEDSDELWSDEEEEEGSLADLSFLRLSFQPEIIDLWCERLQSGHYEDISHILLLLAHNAENESNLELICQSKARLVDAVFNVLSNEMCKKNLCIVRNICKVLFQMSTRGLIKLSWERVGMLMKIILDWSQVKPFSAVNPLTCSQEIQSTLARTLNQLLLEGTAPSMYQPLLEKLSGLAQQSHNGTVNSCLNSFVSNATVH